MKKLLLLLASAIFALNSSGQSNRDYHRIWNSGALPAEIYTPSVEKYRESLVKVNDTLKRYEQKTQQQYYLESSYSIDEMMRSGIVLFNPEYNQYLERIADILLKDEPELRSKMHFYLLRSPVVNAFAAGEGNIFISMGLIAMLDNESQLAFVMSHEIGHIAEEHGLDFYMKASSIDKSGSDTRIMKTGSFNEIMITKNLYSQKLETEADNFGIQTFLKTGYSTSALNGVFDVLKYSYLPYENLKFPKSFFETDHYVVSNNLMLDTVKAITGEPEIPNKAESLKSTHPSIGERREGIKQFIDSSDISVKQLTLVSEDEFLSLRNMARYELPMFYLHNQFYQDAIYSSYLGLQKDSSNYYFQKIIAKSLTCLAKFRNNLDESTYAERIRYNEVEGEQGQVYYMLENMSNAELSVVALSYAYQTHLAIPDDPELLPLCSTLIDDIIRQHFKDDNNFVKSTNISRDSLQAMADKNVVKVEAPADNKSVTKKTGVTKKFTYKKNTSAKLTDGTLSHLLYAFNDYWGNPEFQKLWDDAFEAKRIEDREEDNRLLHNKSTRRHLGIEKVVVMNPFYLRVDERKENAVEYVSSEEGEIKYVSVLQENAKLLDIDLEIIDPLLMQPTDVDRFNDMAKLDDWFSEQLDFGSLQLPGYNQSEIDSIANKYGTDYFLWTGILSIQGRNDILMPTVYILGSVFFFPLLPYGVYELFSPEFEFIYLAILYNVKTFEGEVLKYEYLSQNDSRAVLNSQTYDMLFQITDK